MPGKNKGGMGMFWIPRRHKNHHHKHNDKSNYNNDKKHSAFGGSRNKPQQVPMVTSETNSENTLPKPVLMTANIPPEPVPSTSTSSDKIIAENNGDNTAEDSIVKEHDENDKKKDADSVDGEKDDKKKNNDSDDDEPEQGCGFTCLAITLDCCGCVIS